MKKVIRVTMPDGSEWDIPASLVANNRAAALNKAEKSGSTEYMEEVRFAMENKDVLFDWAANNMNWEDVQHYAKMHTGFKSDYQEGWVNGKKQLISFPETL